MMASVGGWRLLLLIASCAVSMGVCMSYWQVDITYYNDGKCQYDNVYEVEIRQSNCADCSSSCYAYGVFSTLCYCLDAEPQLSDYIAPPYTTVMNHGQNKCNSTDYKTNVAWSQDCVIYADWQCNEKQAWWTEFTDTICTVDYVTKFYNFDSCYYSNEYDNVGWCSYGCVL
ncbi:hypothetical protein Pelo_9388 [Pelomyxa schiedti]|nr:hypothetical protein Pelo_9388 [Pelomyxa schiedti]